MKGLITALGAIDKIVTAVIKWMTIVLFSVLTLLITANILLRVFPITSLHWTDEITEFCFAWMVFFGAAGVWMIKGHFSVGDWIGKVVKGERARNACRLALELITLLFALVFFKYSLDLTIRAYEVTSVFQIPKKIIYSCMPASTLIMVFYSIVFVARNVIGIASPAKLARIEELSAKADSEE
jgi:TRAP-type transport system small permease protein